MEVLLITLLTVLASFVGTLTGFGTSTLMVPVLLLFLPLPQTLLLVGIVHWFGDVWKVWLFKKGFNWKLVLMFGLAGVVGSFVGARIVLVASESLLSQVLGVFLLIYVGFVFLNPRFKMPRSDYAVVTGGGLSGFFAGIFGIGGEVRGAFLSAFDLPKAVYISTSGAIALFVDTTRLITYVSGGLGLPSSLSWGVLVFIPASLVGAVAAKKVVGKIPQKQFRLFVAGFLFLVGIKFLLFSV
jgi:hypothetical protein